MKIVQININKEKKTSQFVQRLATSGIIAIVFSVYEAAVVQRGNISALVAYRFGLGRTTVLLFVVLFVIQTVVDRIGTEYIFKYRYAVGASLVFLCVLFEITGSSIGIFSGDASNIIFGLSRTIRSDEWCVFTPMTWSQYLDPNGAFSYYSSVVRADTTDVFIEYGQPVKSWLMIYKPFLIGYLFLPVAKGMAFFWSGRLIVLFLVSYEFGRLITMDDRRLSLVYAFIITFSPGVQWWFAVCGWVEMLIAFQMSIVIFNKYLTENRVWLKAFYAMIIGVCAGMYALSMYPAWMIPLAYALFVCVSWVIYENVKSKTFRRLEKADAFIIAMVVVILLFSAMEIVRKSGNTINTIMNTAYPGKREVNGGGMGIEYLFMYINNIWYAIKDNAPFANVCETSSFISLFPMGYIIYGKLIYKQKKGDTLCNLLCIVSVGLLIYCFFGFPSKLAKLTLMSFSMPSRTVLVVGFVCVILTIRVLALDIQKTAVTSVIKKDTVTSLVIAGFLAALFVWITTKNDEGYYSYSMILVEIVVYALVFTLMISPEIRIRRIWSIFMIAICLVSGLLVNPVRAGTDDIDNLSVLQAVDEVVEQDPKGIWIAEDTGLLQPNMLIMKGARTINSTNIYPNINRWSKIDPEGKYEEIYNRYAHIQIILDENCNIENKFELIQADCITVYLEEKELRTLNVKYILSTNDFSQNSNMKQLWTDGYYYIYQFS